VVEFQEKASKWFVCSRFVLMGPAEPESETRDCGPVSVHPLYPVKLRSCRSMTEDLLGVPVEVLTERALHPLLRDSNRPTTSVISNRLMV
jgi:hypothetical protein